jgi:D-alanyl-D-alanine carboxypeptidase/D-alanyl-D-alanine-endopeptidase (penicillin-binding protein 4)
VLRVSAIACALVCVLVLVFGAAASASGSGREGSATLRAALAHALTSRHVDPARTGAVAVDLGSGAVVFERHSSLSLAPASVEKLTVAFSALRLLGPSYRFRTEVVADGPLVGRTLHGNLYLVGTGDPTLERSDLASLARQVARRGIRVVSGRVIADESYYDTRRGAPGWKRSFLGIEARPLSALALQGVRLPSLNSSARVAGGAFRAVLARIGVTVEHSTGYGRAPRDAPPLALDYSESLRNLVKEMDHDSDNFVAEMLLKQLGAVIAGNGSTVAGVSVVRAELRRAGIPIAGVRLVDGSGLSRLDRLTASALVELLLAAERDPQIRGPLVSSLAVAGVSGTMDDRLQRRPTRGKVIAKTGTTDEASALAGFVRGRYAFAILQNGSPVNWWSARAAQDRFVRVLARSG